ncbi:MAG: hypothetical protein GWP91_07055 [Rhodobacterales bacterium]|nr:hypothetical protein [Rhodobacterales bacterium]
MSDLSADLKAQVLARWELAAEEAENALKQRLSVAFLGSASSGKDSAIRALFDLDFGQVDPIPGSTDHIRIAALDAAEQVLIINAPGFGDLREDVEAAAHRVLEHLDIAVYVLNCDGGATIDERRDLDEIRALGRPTLVCLNKIDLIRETQREVFIERTLEQLGVDRQDAVVTAFDPLPALSEKPIGVDEVIGWIHSHLDEGGKGLLFAKHLRNRSRACDVIIRTAAKRGAMAGAIPIPGADATAVTAIQVKLISDIAALHNYRIDRDLMLFIIGEALAGGSKGFVRWAVNAAKAAGFIPGGQVVHIATSALGASIGAATTFGVGKAAVAFVQNGGKLTGDQLRLVFNKEAIAFRDAADS